MILSFTGQDLPRRQAKDINLGAAYGMGMWKLARKLGVDVDRAKEILKTYHEGMPFVKKLGGRCMELVLAQGYIRTILGRKRRFNYWEPIDWDKRKSSYPLRNYDEAVERWQEVQRANAHKAMNSMVQGSAADQTKQAIVLLDAEVSHLKSRSTTNLGRLCIQTEMLGELLKLWNMQLKLLSLIWHLQMLDSTGQM